MFSIPSSCVAETFGVELEFTGITRSHAAAAIRNAGIPCRAMGYTHNSIENWKVVTDASVTEQGGGENCEAVSPILRGNEGLQELKTVCQALVAAGAVVNSSCGMHVHHSASGFKLGGLKALVLRYAKAEHLLSHAAGRAGNSYCYTPSATTSGLLSELFAKVKAAKDLQELRKAYCPANMGRTEENTEYRNLGCTCEGMRCECPLRYSAINLGNYALRGTVEFRQAAGTLNWEQVLAWVTLTQVLVRQARTTVPGSMKPEFYEVSMFMKHLRWEGFGDLCGFSLEYFKPLFKAAEQNFAIGTGTPTLPEAVQETYEARRIRLRANRSLWNGGQGIAEPRNARELEAEIRAVMADAEEWNEAACGEPEEGTWAAELLA